MKDLQCKLGLLVTEVVLALSSQSEKPVRIGLEALSHRTIQLLKGKKILITDLIFKFHDEMLVCQKSNKRRFFFTDILPLFYRTFFDPTLHGPHYARVVNS